MTNKTITLACPFCGGEPKVTRTAGDERDGYALRISYVCKGCGCSRGAVGESGKGGYADNSTVDLRALAAWNTRAALAAPVPPAGGEPEVFEPHGWAQTDGPRINAFTQEFDIAEEWAMAGYGTVELLNREHVDVEIDRLRGEHQAIVTRLQAELTSAIADKNAFAQNAVDLRLTVDQLRQHKNDYMEAAEETRKALQAEVDKAIRNNHEWRSSFYKQQSELTKARELLEEASISLRQDERFQQANDIDAFLSNQSAPADKGQGEPVAILSKGFTTLETGDGKYRIITSYPNRDDAWSDYEMLCRAKHHAPTAEPKPTAYDGFDNGID